MPLYERITASGDRRFGIPITIGSSTIEAEFDNGTGGLRVVPESLAADDVHVTTRPLRVMLAGHDLRGTHLDGAVATAAVAVGSSTHAISLQMLGNPCPIASGCSDGRIPFFRLGLRDDSQHVAGFPALFGMSLRSGGIIAQPLIGMGVHRWIVDLPRPGGDPGRLILNPGDDDVRGFVAFPVDRGFATPDALAGNDPLYGCILENERRICGQLVMDVDDPPGVVVSTRGDVGALGSFGASVTLDVTTPAGTPHISLPLTVDGAMPANRLTFVRANAGPPVVIRSGIALFFAFDVLYDADRDTIAFRPRP